MQRPLRNVDHILLSEFDIDKGSVLRFEYPEPTGVAEGTLAELMLPEGAHNREEDWTVFFFNRDADEVPAASPTSRRSSATSIKSPLDHVTAGKIEVVSYKFDVNIQDWEFIGEDDDKEYATFEKARNTPHGEYEIVVTDAKGKIIMTVPIHESLQFTVLQSQFCSVYNVDGTAVGFQFYSREDQTDFGGRITAIRETPPSQRVSNGKPEEKESSSPSRKPFLYCLNLVRTKKDKSVRRGAIVKAMAICSQHQFFHIYKPILVLALEKYFSHPAEEVLAYLYNTINAMELTGMPRLTDLQKQVTRLSRVTASDSDGRDNDETFNTHIVWEAARIPVRVPLTLDGDEYAEASVSTLVKKFGTLTMTIYNALLSEKRIIFLGYNHPAQEVCNYVLSAVLMVAPLRGFLHKAFPYSMLTNLDFLQVPGYIAGVTNPVFEQQEAWWDVLCDLDNGRVVEKKPGQKTGEQEKQQTEPHTALDNEHINETISGINAHYGEFWVRSMFRDYTQHLIDIAMNEEEFVDEATKNLQLEMNGQRITTWKRTQSFELYLKDKAKKAKSRAIRTIDVAGHVRKVKVKRNLPDQEILNIYCDFVENVRTEEELMEFLSHLPESQGGLYPIAVTIFHPLQSVRLCTVVMLRRVDALKVGVRLVSSLNYFLLLAYHRHSPLIAESEVFSIDAEMIHQRSLEAAQQSATKR